MAVAEAKKTGRERASEGNTFRRSCAPLPFMMKTRANWIAQAGRQASRHPGEVSEAWSGSV